METVKASDRTYIRDERGTLRVLDYNPNGIESSAIYAKREESCIESDGQQDSLICTLPGE